MSVKRQFRLTAPVVPEHDIQKTIAKVLTLEIAPAGKVSPDGVCWFSISQENYAGEVPGIRVGRGLVAGVFDMLVLFQGRSSWIELKSRDGSVSEPQRSMAATLLLSGCRIGVARDEQEVLGLLDTWEIPRKHRIRLAA
jgi:hypothetical protein